MIYLTHTCLSPGKVWADCLCDEIDPADKPCIVCEGREILEQECPACAQSRNRAYPEET